MPIESVARPRSAEHYAVLGAALLGLLAVLTVGVLLEPDARGYGTHEQLGLRPCLPMERWGIPCPGCGVTTSVTLAARGRLGSSLATQPFGTALALGAAVAAVAAVLAHLRGRDLYLDLLRLSFTRCVSWVLGALLAAWIYKLAVS